MEIIPGANVGGSGLVYDSTQKNGWELQPRYRRRTLKRKRMGSSNLQCAVESGKLKSDQQGIFPVIYLLIDNR
jgi:hypothetical protein